jgi:hypothetical protein
MGHPGEQPCPAGPEEAAISQAPAVAGVAAKTADSDRHPVMHVEPEPGSPHRETTCDGLLIPMDLMIRRCIQVITRQLACALMWPNSGISWLNEENERYGAYDRGDDDCRGQDEEAEGLDSPASD